MRRLACLVGLSCLLASCAGANQDATDGRAAPPTAKSNPVGPSPSSAAPASVNGRLPTSAVPRSYVIELDVDPSKQRFRGRVRIEVDLASASPWIVLHGRDLALTRVSASSGAHDATKAAARHVGQLVTVRAAEQGAAKDEMVLAFEPPLPSGSVTLELDYDAPFSRSLDGLYRARDRDRDYAFTQFEPTDARRAFPSFDEPNHKTPFELAVRVPRNMIAVSNAPETSRRDEGDHVRFAFAKTLPIPSYLVALAVGEFDVVEGKKTPFPIRVITTKGRSGSARAALEPATEIVEALARTLDVPYPYPKLDLVSVPDFGAGAMENPGLITFREELLLVDPSRHSPAAVRSRDSVIAHELAHQWFGNLVTMQWWDDLWLNESFATWLGDRVLEELRPAYRTALSAVRSGLGVMDFDALPSARPVHRPVHSVSEAMEAFDGITYEKGAAVIRMLERAATPPKFRAGLKTYLEKHAFGNARTSDLLAALSAAANTPLEPIALGFLEQTGVPTVAVERDCAKSKGSLVLSQYPWSPLGAPPPARPLKQWTIPLCVRESGRTPVCTTMSERRLELPLANGCSGWVYPNGHQASYVRLSFPPAELAKLLGGLSKLETGERVGLLANAWASTRAGELPPKDLFSALKAYDNEKERELVEQSIEVLWGIGALLGTGEERTRFSAMVRARLKPRKDALGWGTADTLLGRTGKSPTDDDAHFLRRNVLFTLGELGEDADTLKEADVVAQAWLKDPKSVDPEIGAVALELASRRGDLSRFQALVGAAKKAEEPTERIAALRALGAFDDPNLVTRALDLVFDDVSLKDARYLFDGALRHARSREVVLSWTQSNWDRAVKKFEGHQARRLVGVVFGLCDKKAIDRARAFYKARPIEGGAHVLDDALEQASRCATLADGLRAPLAQALPGTAAPTGGVKAPSRPSAIDTSPRAR